MTKLADLIAYFNTLPEGAEIDVRGLSKRLNISRSYISTKKKELRPDLKAKFNLPKTKGTGAVTELIVEVYETLGKGSKTTTVDIYDEIKDNELFKGQTRPQVITTIGKRLNTNNKPYTHTTGAIGDLAEETKKIKRKIYLDKPVDQPSIVYKVTKQGQGSEIMDVKFPKTGNNTKAKFIKALENYYSIPKENDGSIKKTRNHLIKKFFPAGITDPQWNKLTGFFTKQNEIDTKRPFKYGTKYGSQQHGAAARESKTKTQSAKTFEGMVGLKKRPLAKKLLPDKAFKWGYEPLDLAHRLSLGASKKWGLQQTTSTIGLDRPVVNQVFVEHFQKKLNKIYNIQKDLIKNKPKNWRAQLESTNRMVTSIVNDADNRIVGVTVDEKTLKPRLYGDKFATKWAIDNGWLDTDIKNIKKGSAEYNFIRDHLIEPQVIREAETGLDISKFRNINKEELLKWMNTKKKLNTGIKNQTLELLDKYPEITKPQGALGTQTTRGQFERLIKQHLLRKATTNEDNVCEAVFGMGLAKGGVAGGGCGRQMELEFDNAPEQTLNKISQSNSPKLKTFAQRALSLFPKLGTPGKIAAGAVAGAAAIGALTYNKELGEFVNPLNDDKASQATVTEWIKDNPVKTVAGTSIGFSTQEIPGAYKKARELGRGRTRSALGITGALKPVLTTFGTPAMTALFEVPFGAKRLEEGETMTEVLTDPFGPALGLTFMEPLSRGAGVIRGGQAGFLGGIKRAFNPFDLSNVGTARPGITSQILRMGMSPRVIAGISRLGPYGMLAGAGLAALDQYKKYQNQEGMIYNFFNRDE